MPQAMATATYHLFCTREEPIRPVKHFHRDPHYTFIPFLVDLSAGIKDLYMMLGMLAGHVLHPITRLRRPHGYHQPRTCLVDE
jgi:hypothetical protein